MEMTTIEPKKATHSEKYGYFLGCVMPAKMPWAEKSTFLVAKKLGLEAARPLLALPVDGRRPVPSFELSIGPPELVVTSLKPTADGRGWIVRIFNAVERPETLRLSGPLADREGVYLSNLLEERVKRASGPVEVPGFGIVTLRIER